jgi:hypothetical protein
MNTETKLSTEEIKAYDEGFSAYSRCHESGNRHPTAGDCMRSLPSYLKPEEKIGLRGKFIRGWKDALSALRSPQ